MFDCLDCGVDTRTEYYMVHDWIWSAAFNHDRNTEGMLCIVCIEDRLGYRLRSTDFTDAPVNQISMGWRKSDRLINRLGG